MTGVSLAVGTGGRRQDTGIPDSTNKLGVVNHRTRRTEPEYPLHRWGLRRTHCHRHRQRSRGTRNTRNNRRRICVTTADNRGAGREGGGNLLLPPLPIVLHNLNKQRRRLSSAAHSNKLAGRNCHGEKGTTRKRARKMHYPIGPRGGWEHHHHNPQEGVGCVGRTPTP